ncbi:cupredoxin domain-containing protein [Arhodomonas sp. AD133]|uniref:cupredoxin domain-containing protein n=1 Tax=Arhodomonas sp. AD133 TaxID=3415009 RepID=UPI003EB7C6E2
MKQTSRIASAALVAIGYLGMGAAWAGPGHGAGHGRDFVGGHPGKASEVDRTVEISAADVHFDRKRVEVAAGETVRFVVTNTGNTMHDFTLGTPAVQKAHRREMAELMSQGGMRHHDDPNAVMLKPGETKEVIWTFEQTEAFLFGCNVPGHFEAGMKGEIAILDGSDGEEVAHAEDDNESAGHDS